MGWFWSDATPIPSASQSTTPPHPLPRDSNAQPPPGCPMHKAPAATPPPPPPSSASACPYNPPTNSTPESQPTPSYVSKLNPLNYMPTNISNERASPSQSIALPLERETSTIPRGDDTGTTWEYPSPQQMYNAMLKKGYTDTPADAVESMVAVHNFLNEGAWEEIRDWEHRFSGGLARGWEVSRHGEEGALRAMALEALKARRSDPTSPSAIKEPQLLRFLGRPDDPTPKSRILSLMARIAPSQYPDNPPFDRHDWYVQRHRSDGGKEEVRYVIDYYSGPPEANGSPVFYLDVRPAVDGPRAAAERLCRWGGDVWWRASGGSVREELAKR